MLRQSPQPYFEAALQVLRRVKGSRVLEIGSMRRELADPEARWEGTSTWWFAKQGLQVVSVDIDPAATATAREATKDYQNVDCVTADALEFLEQYTAPIDLLYLDAWDTGSPHFKERHREAYLLARANLHEHSLILIDDTDVALGGKGRLVIQEAEEDGYRILLWGRQTLLARFDPSHFGVQFSPLGPPLPYRQTFPEALKLHQEGFAWEAENAYRQILKREPAHPGALHLLGVACHQAGEYEHAVHYIRQAIALEPTKAVYHNNLGVTLRELQEASAAGQAFEQAVMLNPDYADALSNLGLSCFEVGQVVEAERHLKRALKRQPKHVDALLHLSKVCAVARQLDDALRLADQAIALQPQRADIHLQRAGILRESNRLDESANACLKAIQLQPQLADAHVNLGITYAAQERAEEAERTYARASALRPDKDFWTMRWAGLCPTVFPDTDAIRTFRMRLMDELERFAQRQPQIPLADLAHDAFFPSFFLAHQGFDNRPLKERYAAIYEPLLRGERPAPRSGKPRLGFLVTRGHEGGFLRCMAGIIDRLDPREFDVVILTSHTVAAGIRPHLQRTQLEIVGFPDRLPEAIDTIQAAQCDVIDHWQIGTDTMNYLLPFAPLAPLQTTGWGTHGTSGIRNVDYYVSSDLMELAEADTHYTEKLLRFPTFPTWQKRIPAPPPAKREDFGFSKQTRLYLCPHRLAKMHPDMDAVFAGILRQDPQAIVVLKEGRQGYAAPLLRDRLQITVPDACDRIVILPEQTLPDFYRLLSLADVVLDPLHYSAGLMAYDAFSLNLPLVTLPGKYLVSRYTVGYYQRMNLTDLVVDSVPHYVAQALRTATDRGYRQSLVESIAERSACLFEDEAAVRSYQETFARLVDESRSDRRQ